jgi:hypothetical protein
MDPSTVAWLSLVICGFAFGVANGPMALLRIGIGLMMLSGLGVLLAMTSGFPRVAYWFVIGVTAVVVAVLVAMLGALAGGAVRRLFRKLVARRAGATNRRAPSRP